MDDRPLPTGLPSPSPPQPDPSEVEASHAPAHKAYHEAHNLRLAIALDIQAGEQQPPIKPVGRVTWRDLLGGGLNLLNYILGAGVLGLPYAFSRAGWLLSVLALGVVACGCVASYSFLLWSSRLSGAVSYEQLAQRAFGSRAATFVKWFIIVDSFGPLSAYQTIIGQAFRNFILNHWAVEGSVIDERLITFIILIVILGPLSFVQNIASLAWTSFLSILPLVYLLILEVAMLARHGRDEEAGPVRHFAPDFFLALPIIVFAYSSQQALFPIYRELREQGGTEKHVRGIVKVSVGFTFLTYVWAGIFSYLQFGGKTQPNILNNYGTGIAADILQLTTAVSLVLSFPVIVFPSRYNLDRLLFPNAPLTYRRFVLENLGIIITAYAITVAIPSLAVLFGVFGAVTSTAIGYILPPLFYLALAGPPSVDTAVAPTTTTTSPAQFVQAAPSAPPSVGTRPTPRTTQKPAAEKGPGGAEEEEEERPKGQENTGDKETRQQQQQQPTRARNASIAAAEAGVFSYHGNAYTAPSLSSLTSEQQQQQLQQPRDPKWKVRRIGAWVMLLVGGASGLASFVIVAVDWARQV